MLERAAGLLRERADDFADTIAMEAFPQGAGKLAFALPVPIGVVAAITPFNFPLNLVAHKVAPAVAAKITTGGFGYAGQSCISVQRVLVHQSVRDALRDALKARVEELVVGDPMDEATDVGPMISERERTRVLEWILEATSSGGALVTGGKAQGTVVLPTVIDGPPCDARLFRQEAFGPVVVIIGCDDFEEALDIANDSDFGLHAGVFTNDLTKALRAVRRLDFGGVLINEVPTFRADQQPYGGVRDAGNTREGPAYAVAEMTEVRFVSLPL